MTIIPSILSSSSTADKTTAFHSKENSRGGKSWKSKRQFRKKPKYASKNKGSSKPIETNPKKTNNNTPSFLSPSIGCGVCGIQEKRYKCPKCRLPYCTVSCWKIHKDNCPALQSNSGPSAAEAGVEVTNTTITTSTVSSSKYLPSDQLTEDPLEKALQRRKRFQTNSSVNEIQDGLKANEIDGEEDEEEEWGWRITQEMMDRLDQSAWLRKELMDGGLRQMIYQIDQADMNDSCPSSNSFQTNQNAKRRRSSSTFAVSPREQALLTWKQTNPKFASFIDRLLLTAGVLIQVDGITGAVQEYMEEEDNVEDWNVGNHSTRLVVAPIQKPSLHAKAHVLSSLLMSDHDPSDDDEETQKDTSLHLPENSRESNVLPEDTADEEEEEEDTADEEEQENKTEDDHDEDEDA